VKEWRLFADISNGKLFICSFVLYFIPFLDV
jgi:hypothetical protein